MSTGGEIVPYETQADFSNEERVLKSLLINGVVKCRGTNLSLRLTTSLTEAVNQPPLWNLEGDQLAFISTLQS